MNMRSVGQGEAIPQDDGRVPMTEYADGFATEVLSLCSCNGSDADLVAAVRRRLHFQFDD
jgi:hypothetical protein